MVDRWVECPICGNKRFSVAKRPKCKRVTHNGTNDPEPRMRELPIEDWPEQGTPSTISPNARKKVNYWEQFIPKRED